LRIVWSEAEPPVLKITARETGVALRSTHHVAAYGKGSIRINISGAMNLFADMNFPTGALGMTSNYLTDFCLYAKIYACK
jgi:hypothetical protein